MKDFSELKRNLKKDFSGLKKIKVAILGDTSTQFLSHAIKGAGYEKSVNLTIWEADFNQIERQVFDISSELYRFDADVVVIFQSSHKLLEKYNNLESEKHICFAEEILNSTTNLVDALSNNSNAKIIVYNYTEIDDSVFGNHANKTGSSFLFQLRKLNFILMTYASETSNFYICDISSIQNRLGRELFFHPTIYINTEMVLSIDILPIIATKTVDLISALYGRVMKCLILDLDNTIWGGIIGDDGIENIQIGNLGIGKAFTEFQFWIKKLKNRGVILAVCSKNTESVAIEAFKKHPDMILRLEDISVFVANWDTKVENIQRIQSILNISYDSMVFLDDNPFERNMVRESIAKICVPELPEDPANYLEYLYALNLFETVSFSTEDIERTKLYQVEAKRVYSQQKFSNEDDFLKTLGMQSAVREFNKFNSPRVSQLSQRSNQFNLRTIRYSESDIERIAKSKDFATFCFTLEDKFGEYGLISAVILQKQNDKTLFIDTWIMSCRVLKRGMEQFVLNTLVSYAKGENFEILIGEYIPTKKNEIVKNLYRRLGFKEIQLQFFLDVNSYQKKYTNIVMKEIL